MKDSIVDPKALNLSQGQFGTTFNGQTYQIDALATLNDWQYATYVDSMGRVCVARRQLPDGDWDSLSFDDYVIDHTDVHNVPVLGICPSDGTIHLAFDHHNSPLHYRVSQPGVATSPESIAWSTDLFGPITSELVRGVELTKLTYPIFVTMPDGALQLYYRIGMSGDGDTHLAEYRPDADGWKILGAFVSGQGRFVDSTSRNAYHNGFDFDTAGRLHTTWVWRESINLLSNHDLQYAYSDDSGHTWRNREGTRVGVTGQEPMHLHSRGITVRPIPYGWGMMNQVTQTLDDRGRIHVVLWQQPPTAAEASADLGTWRYVHYWGDDRGTWHQHQLPYFGRKPTVLAGGDDLILVFTKSSDPDYHGKDSGGPLYVIAAASADEWSTWREIYRSTDTFVGEPRVDRHRWQASGVLSIYAQQAPTAPGAPSPLRVLDIDPEVR
ncbi:BNR repeat-containing protein [Actinopolymorpha alba]|uniref:BNR repeat-containing protein n=1 Tax=Actinopolymorpha alba TaxID=533267 RepID=UPI0012F70094|nr:BNR repeat-containing protein [Actinopolymorpha alba]